MSQTIQKPNAGAYVLSTRLKTDAFKSIHKLISTAGYKDTSSFVRDAVDTKCKDLVAAIKEIEAL